MDVAITEVSRCIYYSPHYFVLECLYFLDVSFNNVWFSDEAHYQLGSLVVNKMCDFVPQRIHV
jgi:hypothetical protein